MIYFITEKRLRTSDVCVCVWWDMVEEIKVGGGGGGEVRGVRLLVTQWFITFRKSDVWINEVEVVELNGTRGTWGSFDVLINNTVRLPGFLKWHANNINTSVFGRNDSCLETHWNAKSGARFDLGRKANWKRRSSTSVSVRHRGRRRKKMQVRYGSSVSHDAAQKKEKEKEEFLPHIAFQISLGKFIHYLQPWRDKVTLKTAFWSLNAVGKLMKILLVQTSFSLMRHGQTKSY